MVGGDGMTSPPTVWVLVHDLGRSGVPVVLVRLLRAVAASRSHVHVVALRGGPLEATVRGVAASVTTLEPAQGRSVADAVAVGMHELGHPRPGRNVRRLAWRRRVRHLPAPDVVVLHGAGGWPVLDVLRAEAPLVVHLHELGIGLDRSVPVSRQRELLSGAVRVLAVSRPVADLAVARGAAAARVELVPGVVDRGEVDGAVAGPRGGDTAEPVAGRPVMGAGVVGWRKGTDRLAAVAFELDRSGRRDQVGWVGGHPGGPDAAFVGSTDPVRWYPSCSDPWGVMDAARVVVVPSREDPLPLVALEAGQRRKAVVAMPTGGLPELLSHGRGRVVAGQDVIAFAHAVRHLLEAPDEAVAAGDSLHDHVMVHHDAAVVAPRWWQMVSSSAEVGPARR